jgi:hypothetical protein
MQGLDCSRNDVLADMRRLAAQLGLLALLLLALNGYTQAQATNPDEETLPGTPVEYGVVTTGRLDNRTPRTLYRFEGLRGEYVSIRVRATDGDLDPVLSVLDENGSLLVTRDDAAGQKWAVVRQMRIPRSGSYQVVVGRFGYGLGSTSGGYDLLIERVGVSFESGSALRYGDTVVNTITDETPEIYYTFRARRGDIVTLTMRRDTGTLDPLLRVINSALRIVAENDDMPGSTDAQVAELVIEEEGTYAILATRYLGTGSFLLSLHLNEGSGEGASPQVAIRLRPGQPVEGELTVDRYQQFYRIEASRDDIVTLRMTRTGGTIDSYLVLANAALQEMVSDDDSAGNQNALIENYRIPQDGVYYVIATRYEREAGTTIGRYRLELTSRGNAFAGVAEGAVQLNYNTNATGAINDMTDEVLYAFYGIQGDSITALMNRTNGDLQPALFLLDNNQQVISESGGGNANVSIENFTLPRTGLYYLRASRADDDSSGGFVLVLVQRESS